MSEFNIGDLVVLKSPEGPVMTVVAVGDVIRAMWFSRTLNRSHDSTIPCYQLPLQADFPPEALEYAEE